MNDSEKSWTKEEYLAHLRRPASERNKESKLEKGLLYSFVFLRGFHIWIIIGVIAAVSGVVGLLLD